MAFKIVKKGTADQYNDHSRLNNLELENQHPIEVIIGLRDYLKGLDNEDIRIDEEVKKLDSVVDEIVKKIESGEIGGGSGNSGASPSPLKGNISLEYDGNKLIKETYTGDVNKVVKYIYKNGNVTEKIVTRKDGKTVKAAYEYDTNGNLINVVDEGVNEVIVAGGGSGGGDDLEGRIEKSRIALLNEIEQFNKVI